MDQTQDMERRWKKRTPIRATCPAGPGNAYMPPGPAPSPRSRAGGSIDSDDCWMLPTELQWRMVLARQEVWHLAIA